MKKIILLSFLFFIGAKNLIKAYITGETIYIFPYVILGLALPLSVILYLKDRKTFLPIITIFIAYALCFLSWSLISFELSFESRPWYTSYHRYIHIIDGIIFFFIGIGLSFLFYGMNNEKAFNMKMFISFLPIYAIGILIEVPLRFYEYKHTYVYEGVEIYSAGPVGILLAMALAILLFSLAFALIKKSYAKYSGIILALILLVYGAGQTYVCSPSLLYESTFYRCTSLIVAILTVPLAYILLSINIREVMDKILAKGISIH